ncbi:unnamed protein product [Leptosia nina]|uniref:Uncharacterized protein n=1 Tax=Leptosia nina TaxID=320188 RepID=A0AAV1JTI4_9NEOP
MNSILRTVFVGHVLRSGSTTGPTLNIGKSILECQSSYLYKAHDTEEFQIIKFKYIFTNQKALQKLNYMLCGVSAWWWHAVNVLLHAACCVLVARTGAVVARLQRPFAALAALLFAVHPIHTEAVSLF